jgi:hypothetical protein
MKNFNPIRKSFVVLILCSFSLIGFCNIAQIGGSSNPFIPIPVNHQWFYWTENEGGTSYGNATIDAWTNNSIAVGCATTPDMVRMEDYSEQTLQYWFLGYTSTSFLVQNVSYGLLFNSSANALSDNIKFKLYLSYETAPNSTSDYYTVSTDVISLSSGIPIDNATNQYLLQGTISIPNNGGYVCSLMLEAYRPFNSGGGFNVGFDYAYMNNATSNGGTTIQTQSPITISTEDSYIFIGVFVVVILVSILIIMRKKKTN